MSKPVKSQGGVGLKLNRETESTAPKQRNHLGKFSTETSSGMKADTTGGGLRTEEQATLKGLKSVPQTHHTADLQ